MPPWNQMTPQQQQMFLQMMQNRGAGGMQQNPLMGGGQQPFGQQFLQNPQLLQWLMQQQQGNTPGSFAQGGGGLTLADLLTGNEGLPSIPHLDTLTKGGSPSIPQQGVGLLPQGGGGVTLADLLAGRGQPQFGAPTPDQQSWMSQMGWGSDLGALTPMQRGGLNTALGTTNGPNALPNAQYNTPQDFVQQWQQMVGDRGQATG